MTSAEILRSALLTVKATESFTEAVMRFHDNSRLCFCHRVGERWAKAISPDQQEEEMGYAGEFLSAMTMFRLNAKHLDIQFQDGSRWDEPLPMDDESDSYPLEIDCHCVKRMSDADDELLLLDCRDREEHATVQIEGSKLIPMSEIPARLSELAPYRDNRIVVHCHIGVRSLYVAKWLRSQGFRRVQSMSGGIDAWAQQINPVLPRY